ncbi:glycosyltransferase [Dyella japonica]|uniref:Glycosyl transferase n=1 Tax=Dyella japonica A8 TaxID=1217721 RepID=A0A075K2F9_9GAMM|nr:glycosyltransferase [Dyella japonica]AIF48060.1 glycosyl transferase [Dyella japonica A8]
MWAFLCAIVPALMWLGLLLVPWRPWSTREHLEADPSSSARLDDITVLIPARNEAEVIGTTLRALQAQGAGLQIIVIDDQSTDGTAAVASAFANVRVIPGTPLPDGWAGKLWALEQGRQHVHTPLTLLLDADIELRPGMLTTLLSHKQREQRRFVSIMADLRRTSFWDRLLLPAFVYYFKLLYPFAVSNSRSTLVAAGAGGCILLDTDMLERIGGFASLRDALIDDCTLARQVKRAGGRTWIGLSRDVVSLRPYGSFDSIHRMVARSAFTQLGYSTALLLVVTMLFLLAYGAPLALLGAPHLWPLAWVALLAMMLGYLPMLRYYRMPLWWALLLPLGAALYLGMTWSSAIRYWRGVRSQWKGRVYGTGA